MPTEKASTMTARRSAARQHIGRSLWYVEPGVIELRAAPVDPVMPGQARVRTLWSGISRGTERLVFHGKVGPSEWERMRAPLQQGTFPFPVKYGYCATGIVEDGPSALQGKSVFCLHPHQDIFVASEALLVPIPADVPARRATLAANMETALNAHWDGASGPGDRVVVVGAGVVGLLVAHLAAAIPGTHVTVVDVSEPRRPIAEALGARFAMPEDTPADADIVFHTSANAQGLATAIDAAGFEAAIVDLSWYGSEPVPAPLGGAFHSRRLRLISSQVGHVSPARRPRWTLRRRLETALELLRDPTLDRLVAEEIAFEDAPRLLPGVLAPNAEGLAPVIRYAQS